MQDDAVDSKAGRGEQMGYVVHPAARMPVMLVLTVFFAPYLVKLAKFAANDNDQVYWMGIPIAPMGYVSSFTFLSTFCVSALAPLIGSISDHLPSRRTFFRDFTIPGISATYMAILLYFPGLWWVGGLLVAMITVSYQLSALMLNAYLPEIANDKQMRTKLSAHSAIFGNVGQLIALIIGIGIALSLGSENLSIRSGSFELMSAKSSTWSIRELDSVVEFIEPPSNSPPSKFCNLESSICQPISIEDPKDKERVLFIKSNERVGIFQRIRATRPQDFIGKRVMTTLWAKSISTGAKVDLILWINGKAVQSSSLVHEQWKLLRVDSIFGKEPPYSIFVETIAPSDAKVYIDKFEFTVQPDALPPLFVACAGFFWHYVTLMVHHNLKPRPANHPLPQGKSYITAAFSQLLSTLQKTRSNPMLLRFLLSVACFSAVNQAAYPSLTVFLSEELGFGTAEIGMIFVEAQLVGIVGALLTIKMGSSFGYLRTYCIALFGYLVSILLICVLIDKNTAYLVWPMVAFIAIFTASTAVLTRSLYASMIPEKQEAEFTGLMYFFEWAFAWTGSLVFSIAYKVTGDMKHALASLTLLGGFAFFLAFSLDDSVFVVRN